MTMTSIDQMLEAHPAEPGIDQRLLAETVKACFECAQVCTSCADACLAEDQLEMLRRCIRLDLDCADVCVATGRVIARQTMPAPDVVTAQLRACVAACRACAAECGSHAGHHEHCRACAESCKWCEEMCERLLREIEFAAA